jgi:hypothetical protein
MCGYETQKPYHGMCADISFIANSFYSLKAVFLGRLITDIRNPAEDFWPKVGPRLSKDEYVVEPFHTLDGLLTAKASTNFRAKLVQSIGMDYENKNSAGFDLFTRRARIYRLLWLCDIGFDQ